MIEKKQPDPIDVYVGGRIRLRRHQLGLTQSDVGGNIGVRFQQLQKYETGANRVSASKLWAIAQYLQVPVSWFFEGYGEVPSAEIERMNTPEAVRLVNSYFRLDGRQRNSVARLIDSMGAEQATAAE